MIGMSLIESFEREVTTVRSAPGMRARPATMARMVRATPLTSSSVSVNQARFSLRSGCGTVPVKSPRDVGEQRAVGRLLAEGDEVGQHAEADRQQAGHRLEGVDQVALARAASGTA